MLGEGAVPRSASSPAELVLSRTCTLPSVFQTDAAPVEASSCACCFPLLFVLSVRIVNYSGMKPEISLKCLAQESPLGAAGIKMRDTSELNFCLHIFFLFWRGGGGTVLLVTNPWCYFVLRVFTVQPDKTCFCVFLNFCRSIKK